MVINMNKPLAFHFSVPRELFRHYCLSQFAEVYMYGETFVRKNKSFVAHFNLKLRAFVS